MDRKKERLDKRVQSAEPINNQRDIARIRSVLANRPRDLLLFELLIHTGLPAQQLLYLKVKDIERLEIGDTIKTSPTGSKLISFTISERVYLALRLCLKEKKLLANDFLFASRKGTRPITLPSMSRMVKGWLKTANIPSSSSILSLRKTSKLMNFASGAGSNREASVYKVQTFKPVSVRTKQEIVLEELERSILSGRIPPGERLLAEEIARQMKVSRIPVREALGRLQALGFISLQKGGSIVNELSKENVREILKIRLILEAMAAEQATLQLTEEKLQKLEILHDNLLSAWNDVDELLRINREFHFTIYRGAGMPILQSLIETLWNKFSPYLHILIRDTDEIYPEYASKIHTNILSALKRRDIESVIEWLRRDLIRAAEAVLTMFERARS